MDNTGIIIDKMSGLAIDGNPKRLENWGVLFNTVKTPKGFPWGVPALEFGESEERDEAWVISNSFICRWTDFGKLNYNPNAPFYNVEENEWTRNTATAEVGASGNRNVIGVNLLHQRLEDIRPKSDGEREFIAKQLSEERGVPVSIDEIHPGAARILRIPFTHLYYLLNVKYSTKQSRANMRVVIKSNTDPGYCIGQNSVVLVSRMVDNVGLVLKLDEDMRQQFFPHISPDKYYTVDMASEIGVQNIRPNRRYECTFVDKQENENTLSCLEYSSIVNVKCRIFKGIEVMAHDALNGYLLDETLEMVNCSKYYETEKLLHIPFSNPYKHPSAFEDRNFFIYDEKLDDSYYKGIPTIHLDGEDLANILDLFRGFEFPHKEGFIDFYIGPSELHPIIITPVRPSVNFPTIQVIMSPLKHDSKGYIK